MGNSETFLPSFVEGQAYDRNLRSRVWKIEEKKTDANLRWACATMLPRAWSIG
jgi:hypothetical protein